MKPTIILTTLGLTSALLGNAQTSKLTSSSIPAGGSNWMVMGAIVLVVFSYLLHVYIKKRRSKV